MFGFGKSLMSGEDWNVCVSSPKWEFFQRTHLLWDQRPPLNSPGKLFFFFPRKRWWLGEGGCGHELGEDWQTAASCRRSPKAAGRQLKMEGVGGRGWGPTRARLGAPGLNHNEGGGRRLSFWFLGWELRRRWLQFVVMRPTETGREKKQMEKKKKNLFLSFPFFFIKSFTIWQKYALCEIKTKK